MSTSPSTVAAPRTSGEQSAVWEPFPYDSVIPGSDSADPFSGAAEQEPLQASSVGLAEARAQGRVEGEAVAWQRFEARIAEERARIAVALAEFKQGRAAYLQRVEAEVVQLALSIARKVLHREAQIDPLVLVGIVRVALEKIDGATELVLRIHPQNAPDWRKYLTTHLRPEDLPKIVEDPSQAHDQCSLETNMGTTRMGLDLQLKEIEQGLMDLLSARTGGGS